MRVEGRVFILDLYASLDFAMLFECDSMIFVVASTTVVREVASNCTAVLAELDR